MFKFVILSALVAVAVAKPGHLGLGYSAGITSYAAAAPIAVPAAVSHSYRSDIISQPLISSYAAPALTSYAAPALTTYAAPAVRSYVAPALTSYATPALTSYSAPALTSYSTPVLRSYAAPALSYGAAW